MNSRSLVPARQRGFTLIELVVAVAIVAILAAIALPSYRGYVTRGSREAVQSELVELAGVQEKIFLNSNAYTNLVTNAYTGASTGGLGVTTGRSRDSRYTFSATVTGASFTLTATPVSGSTQASDGNLSIDSQGQRLWGSKTW
jgi:type IV pilus assembly protein PilE